MDRKLVGTMLIVLASCGCRACDNSCDYLPPVLDSPYTTYGMRAGSSVAGNHRVPMPVEGEVITPTPTEE